MTDKPSHEFGKRRPLPAAPISSPPVKRSSHVALLLMGTLAVGGGAYALMPRENCAPSQPGMAVPGNAGCSPRSSSSGGGSSRYGFYSGDSTANKSPSASPSGSSSGNVTRGGFGSFAHAFTSHFSGGG